MGYVLEGFRMVFTDRRYWRYIVIPWVWSTLIFLAVVVLGYFLFVPAIQGWIDSRVSGYEGTIRAVVSLAYAGIWFFIAGFVFLTITAITSSFLWEGLSQRVEEQITGNPAPKSSLATMRIVSDSVSRGVFAILIAILSLFCGWVVPIVAPVILAGWVGLLDYTSPAFLRYNRTIGQQWPVATKMKGWFGFQVASGLLTLVPLVNILMLPALVAGGTSMAVRSGALKQATQVN
jgi:uncharacterized protein involved in cysteine biosynthesis